MSKLRQCDRSTSRKLVLFAVARVVVKEALTLPRAATVGTSDVSGYSTASIGTIVDLIWAYGDGDRDGVHCW